MRLIDVDTLKFTSGINEDGVLYVPYRDICGAPTVNAEPVRHGHWEERPLRKFPEEHIDVCGVCGGKALAKYNYCPNCGADMRGGHIE